MVDFEKYRGEIVSCSNCGYPILVGKSPEIKCPYCGTKGIVEEVNMIGLHPHGEHVCICTKCGAEIAVAANTKCNTQTCPVCGNPMVAKEAGERRLSGSNIAQNGDVTLPTWLVASSIGLVIGIVFGPVLLASTREGALKLARIAEEKLKQR